MTVQIILLQFVSHNINRFVSRIERALRVMRINSGC